MRFTKISYLAIPALVAADALSDVFSDFNTIASTDSAALSKWVQSYASVAESYYASIYYLIQSQIGASATSDASYQSELRAQLSSVTANFDYSDYSHAIHSTDIPNSMSGQVTESISDFAVFSSQMAAASSILAEASASLTMSSGASHTGSSGSAASSGSGSGSSSGSGSGSSSASASGSSSGQSSHSGSDSSHASGSGSSHASGSSGTTSGGSSSSGRSTSQSSSRGSSSSGMGEVQAPMLIGAALAGLSVLLL